MQTFRKQERLCNRSVIHSLFTQGNSFKTYPFIVNWGEFPYNESAPLKMMFAVSTRTCRYAVDRNRVRRLLREAYRKNKMPLLDMLRSKQRSCSLIILFTGREKLTAGIADAKIILILQRLQSIYEKAAG